MNIDSLCGCSKVNKISKRGGSVCSRKSRFIFTWLTPKPFYAASFYDCNLRVQLMDGHNAFLAIIVILAQPCLNKSVSIQQVDVSGLWWIRKPANQCHDVENENTIDLKLMANKKHRNSPSQKSIWLLSMSFTST